MADLPGVHLVRTDENVDEIEALATRFGGRVGLPSLLEDLNRRARRTWAPGRAVHRAYTWDAADRRDPTWWPQGVTTAAEAEPPSPLVVVSWYAKGDQGSRLTFLDLATRRYRHVLLVQPTASGFTPLKVHAGGIVWHGPYLHVAATARGFFTCRLDDLLRVPAAGEVESYGHRYVLPVRFAYRAHADTGLEKLRYSFLSLDQDADPPELVVGEYGGRSQTRRLARFGVDPATKFLAEEERVSRPLALEEEGVVRAQGAAIAAGTWYVTSSHGPWTPGSVHVGAPGAFRTYRWATPMGPEDIAWDRDSDLLWSVTEHPRRRWVFSMERRWFDRR